MQAIQHGRVLKGPGAHRVKPLHERHIKKARDFALAETMKHIGTPFNYIHETSVLITCCI